MARPERARPLEAAICPCHFRGSVRVFWALDANDKRKRTLPEGVCMSSSDDAGSEQKRTYDQLARAELSRAETERKLAEQEWEKEKGRLVPVEERPKERKDRVSEPQFAKEWFRKESRQETDLSLEEVRVQVTEQELKEDLEFQRLQVQTLLQSKDREEAAREALKKLGTFEERLREVQKRIEEQMKQEVRRDDERRSRER